MFKILIILNFKVLFCLKTTELFKLNKHNITHQNSNGVRHLIHRIVCHKNGASQEVGTAVLLVALCIIYPSFT